MDDIGAGTVALGLVVAIFLGFVLGSADAKGSIIEDCKLGGQTRISAQLYECRPVAAITQEGKSK